MNDLFAIIAILVSLLTVLLYSSGIRPAGDDMYVVLKATCAAVFVLTAVVGLILNKKRSVVNYLILAGTVFGIAGDVLLALSYSVGAHLFTIGLISFLINHVLYITAFCFADRPRIRDAVLCLVIYAPMVALMMTFKGMGAMAVPAYIYAFSLALMLAKAISLAFAKGKTTELTRFLLVIGAVLWTVSDIVLCIGMYGNVGQFLRDAHLMATIPVSTWLNTVNTFTYFIGQTMIACMAFYYRKQEEPVIA